MFWYCYVIEFLIISCAVSPGSLWRFDTEKTQFWRQRPLQCQERLKITKSAILPQLLSIELNFVHITMTLHHRDIVFMAIPRDLDPDPSRRSTAARENDEN